MRVGWIYTGWGANWMPHAQRAESAFDDADVLVLMSLVRTNLGRRLRRTAKEAAVPWVACTAHGQKGIERALSRAIDLAVTRRLQARR